MIEVDATHQIDDEDGSTSSKLSVKSGQAGKEEILLRLQNVAQQFTNNRKVKDELLSISQKLESLLHDKDAKIKALMNEQDSENDEELQELKAKGLDKQDAVASWIINEFFNESTKTKFVKHHTESISESVSNANGVGVLRLSISVRDQSPLKSANSIFNLNSNGIGADDTSNHVILERQLSDSLQTTFQQQNDSQPGSSSPPNKKNKKQIKLSKFGKIVKKLIQRRNVIETIRTQSIYAKAKTMFNHAICDPIKRFLATNDSNWEIDMFDFENLCTQNDTNPFISFCIYFVLPYCQSLRISSRKVLAFLMDIGEHYLPANQVIYHNALHAADVLFTSQYFLTNTTFFGDVVQLTSLEKFAVLISSAVHDVGHPGFNNTYQIKTQSELSIKYNDQSVLENFHTSLTFRLLQKSENNFFKELTLRNRKYFRHLLIKLVLGTDMKKHSSQVKLLNSYLPQLESHIKETNRLYQSKMTKMKKLSIIDEKVIKNANNKTLIATQSNLHETNATNHGDDSDSNANCSSSSPDSIPLAMDLSDTIKVELMEILLHVSDISNPARTFSIAEKWAKLISQEFFKQGDMEAIQGLEISPLCNRHKTKLGESQVGFITYVVYPLFDAWSKIVPEISVCLKIMEHSKKLWQNYLVESIQD